MPPDRPSRLRLVPLLEVHVRRAPRFVAVTEKALADGPDVVVLPDRVDGGLGLTRESAPPSG